MYVKLLELKSSVEDKVNKVITKSVVENIKIAEIIL